MKKVRFGSVFFEDEASRRISSSETESSSVISSERQDSILPCDQAYRFNGYLIIPISRLLFCNNPTYHATKIVNFNHEKNQFCARNRNILMISGDNIGLLVLNTSKKQHFEESKAEKLHYEDEYNQNCARSAFSGVLKRLRIFLRSLKSCASFKCYNIENEEHFDSCESLSLNVSMDGNSDDEEIVFETSNKDFDIHLEDQEDSSDGSEEDSN